MPNYQELRSAKANLSLSPAGGDPSEWEWHSEIVAYGVPSYALLSRFSDDYSGGGPLVVAPEYWEHYRCFIPAQGYEIEFLSEVPAPWWLTVALLGTGMALQWRYARGRETTFD
ncbi:MAG: hypothetical protein JRH19_25595 [Deltaproteobacteria bacterium]|nr:hypothetical protein [Deltaproteobacteria bacterium]